MSTIAVRLPSPVRERLRITSPEDEAIKLASIMKRATPAVDSIVKGLPGISPRSVLDIGAGLGAKTLLLVLALPTIERVVVMDGDGTGQHQGKFRENMKAWTNVMDGFEFLHANLPKHIELSYQYADPKAQIDKVDMIVSFRAWGHHFGVGTYIDLAKRSLNYPGLIVVDVRRNQGGEKVFEKNGFDLMKVLPDESAKCRRLVYQKRLP